MTGLPQRILVEGFIRKAIFKADRKKRKIFCFVERDEMPHWEGDFYGCF